MNLDQLSALGQGVGGIAVVISLIYLALQVRASSKATKVASLQNAVSNYESHLLPAQYDQDLALIVLKGLHNDPLAADWLKPEERLRFHFFMSSIVLHFMELTNSHRHGLLDRITFDAWQTYTAQCLATTGGRAWWATSKTLWPQEVYSLLDSRINNVDPTDQFNPYFRLN